MSEPPSTEFLALCRELSSGKLRPVEYYLAAVPSPFALFDDIGRTLLFHVLLLPGEAAAALAEAFLVEGAPAAGVYPSASSLHACILRHPLSALAASSHSSDSKRHLAQALLSHGALDDPGQEDLRTDLLLHLHRYYPDFHAMLMELEKSWSVRVRLLSEASTPDISRARPAL